MAELDPRKHALTPLMIAVSDGDIRAVLQILASGADVNARDNRGGTALMYAVMNQQADITRLLLDVGADPHLKTHRGLSAIAIAENNDFRGLLKILSEAVTRIDAAKRDAATSNRPKPIQTHYDNLKVARDAPIEVIRAAYRSLSQKYHPDRNPQNADAARIMPLLNGAYEVLSDPVKRRTHDQWISQTESRGKPFDGVGDQTRPQTYGGTENRPPKSPGSNATDGVRFVSHMRQWWGAYLTGAAVIWVGIILSPPMRQAPTKNSASVPQSVAAPAAPISEQPSRDSAYSDLVPRATPSLPRSRQEGPSSYTPSAQSRPATAPNGNPWSVNSGYIKGYPRRFTDGGSSVTVDNTQNDSDVFVKLFTLNTSPPSAVRTFFIRARSQYMVANVRAGPYDVRYEDLDSGARAKSESFELEQVNSDTGVRFSRLTMTLYKVAHGNMRTYPISDYEFQ